MFIDLQRWAQDACSSLPRLSHTSVRHCQSSTPEISPTKFEHVFPINSALSARCLFILASPESHISKTLSIFNSGNFTDRRLRFWEGLDRGPWSRHLRRHTLRDVFCENVPWEAFLGKFWLRSFWHLHIFSYVFICFHICSAFSIQSCCSACPGARVL